LLKSDTRAGEETTSAAIVALQQLMDKYAGPLRTESGLLAGLAEIARLESTVSLRPPSATRFSAARRDWFDLRNMLLVARTIASAALSRCESRGAHQREDYPRIDSQWELNQTLRLRCGELVVESQPLGAHLREFA
jgi:succinate dehydrogenase/fumarate reductase flavoprotein subunit